MLVGIARTPGAAIWAWRLAHAGGFPLGVTFYHIACVMRGRYSRPTIWLAYVFAAVSVVLCAIGLAMSNIRLLFGNILYHHGNMLYLVLFVVWHVIVVWGHAVLFQAYRRAKGATRSQFRLIFFAMITGFLGGTSVLWPMIGVQIPPWGNFSIPAYSLIVSYAIVRYKFTDARIVLTQAGVLLGTYLVVLGLPFLVASWGESELEARLGAHWWLVPLGLCAVLATVGPFAYVYLRNKAEARLMGDRRRYQQVLQRAARGMTRVRSLGKLTRLIVRVVSQAVRVRHASLLLWDKEAGCYLLVASHGPHRLATQSRYGLEPTHELVAWLLRNRQVLNREELLGATAAQATVEGELEHLEAVLVVPGFIEQELVGFLVLGEKLSGGFYTSDDFHAFSTLANEAAIAIENARSYEELVKVNEQLKLAYDRLMQQERLAAAGQFATGMAHEIKNPLSAIKTFAEFLPQKYGDPEFREKFFRIVPSEIDRINGIVRELLDFAKPAPLQLEPVNVSHLIEETLQLLSNQSLKQGVDVQTTFRDNGAFIQADPKQLRQVFLNILLNSLEAMPSGGRLALATELTDHVMRVQLVDTGCGISAEQQARLFNPFCTTKERGMGLGLAIVKGVIERHGGAIAIHSQPQVGTTVEVTLPVAT